MAAEGAEGLDPSDDSDADIAALLDEVQLLGQIRAGLQAQLDSETMVEAVTGLIEERQAELEHSRRPPE